MEAPFKERVASRKFLLMLSILLGSTLILIFPAFVQLVSSVKLAAMLGGGEYVSLILGSFGIYAGANVFQKKVNSGVDIMENNNE